MGRLRKGSVVLNQNTPISPSKFCDDIYNDKNRCVIDGRSHNMLTDLRILIDDAELSHESASVSRVIESFQTEMYAKDHKVYEMIEHEKSKNLVRMDMLYNICKILKDSKWNERIGLSFKIYGELTSDEENTGEVYLNEEYDEHVKFYSMIKHWVISDYFNPTIRSEMIWDMLLSDFICDMMRKKYSNATEDVYLLAKEFPYSKTGDLSELKGPKVDYLVGIDKVLYFVELKTSLGSFENQQYTNYLKYACNNPDKGFRVEDLWKRYIDIVKKHPGKDNGHYHKNTGSQKYRYQVDRMKRVCGKSQLTDDDFFAWISGYYNEIRLTYITFKELPNEKIDQIVLGDFDNDNLGIFEFKNEDDDEKRLRWKLVLDIIHGVMDGKMPEDVDKRENET